MPLEIQENNDKEKEEVQVYLLKKSQTLRQYWVSNF